MNAQTNIGVGADAEFQRIRRQSNVLAWCSLCVAIVLPLGIVWGWIEASSATLANHAGLPESPLYAMSLLQFWQRVAGIGLSMVPAGFMVFALLRVRRCFLLFATGRFFEGDTVRALSEFAAGIFWATVSGLLVSSLLSVLLTLGNPSGYRHVAVAFGAGQIFALLLSGLVWLIASVMARAVILAEENAQFI